MNGFFNFLWMLIRFLFCIILALVLIVPFIFLRTMKYLYGDDQPHYDNFMTYWDTFLGKIWYDIQHQEGEKL